LTWTIGVLRGDVSLMKQLMRHTKTIFISSLSTKPNDSFLGQSFSSPHPSFHTYFLFTTLLSHTLSNFSFLLFSLVKLLLYVTICHHSHHLFFIFFLTIFVSNLTFTKLAQNMIKFLAVVEWFVESEECLYVRY